MLACSQRRLNIQQDTGMCPRGRIDCELLARGWKLEKGFEKFISLNQSWNHRLLWLGNDLQDPPVPATGTGREGGRDSCWIPPVSIQTRALLTKSFLPLLLLLLLIPAPDFSRAGASQGWDT